MKRFTRLQAIVAAVLAIVLLAGACTSSKKSNTSTGPSATTAAPVNCPGTPLKFTQIDSLTGPIGVPGRQADEENGLKAALTAINNACTAHRPIQITLCDDQSDPNQSTTCGRQAASDSIAIFGDTGISDNGVNAAKLPGVMLNGAGLWALTNPQAYSSTNVVAEIIGVASAAAGLKKKNLVWVAPNVPAITFAVDLCVKQAKAFGLKAQAVYYPPTTTDFTALAAQVAALHPDAIGEATQSPAFYTAFASEGLSPKNVAIISDVSVVPPVTIASLKGGGEGLYLLSPDIPAQDSSNPGIQQMQKEWNAAGITADLSKTGTYAVAVWSKAHALASILSRLPASEVQSLTGAQLTAALVAAGPITPLASAPFDFSNPHALSQISGLAPFRVFTADALLTQVVNGTYKRISDFATVASPLPISNG